MTDRELLTQLEWRYAVKKFDSSKKIPENTWKAIEDALVLSPSSYGLQPWQFIVIQDSQVRKTLTPFSWKQTQIEDCSHLVVFATRTHVDEAYITKFIERTAEVRGIPAASVDGYKKMMIGDLVQGPRSKMIADWAARQAYIALGNLMTSAAILGIDTCPLEGIEPAKYDEVLGLNSTNYRTAVACAVGYRSSEDKYAAAKKVRFNKAEVLKRV